MNLFETHQTHGFTHVDHGGESGFKYRTDKLLATRYQIVEQSLFSNTTQIQDKYRSVLLECISKAGLFCL